MKKILYVVDSNLNTIGGTQKSTLTIINEMLKHNYCIELLEPSIKEKTTNIDKVKVLTYKGRPNRFKYLYMFFYKIWKIRKCIRKEKPDIVHAQNAECGVLLGLLKKFKLIRNTKCIFTDRGYYTGYSKQYQKLLKFVGKSFDLVITTTEMNKEEWLKYIKGSKVKCVMNALDNEWFDYSLSKEKELRKKYNVENTFNVGFSARYEAYKRWDVVEGICKELLNVPNVKFVYAITADNSYQRDRMNEFLKHMKEVLKDKLILIVDANQHQMEEFYYILDAFVLTSDKESFGRTLLEAMTKNTLTFGTNNGGVPNVISNNEFLFEVANCKEAANLIKKYVDDSLKTQTEKENFLNYVKKNFTTERLNNNLNNIYKSL